MPDALRQSCFNHPDREASARCPACGNFFCHECVVEHGSRIICASCLAKETADGKGPAGANVFLRISAMLLSFALAWLLFSCICHFMPGVKVDFHENAAARSADEPVQDARPDSL